MWRVLLIMGVTLLRGVKGKFINAPLSFPFPTPHHHWHCIHFFVKTSNINFTLRIFSHVTIVHIGVSLA